MKRMLLTLTAAALCAAETFAAPLGPGFTYQGHLNDGGQPATGRYDMIFNLYDDPTNGNVLGTYSIFGGVPVTNGLFSVELNAYGEFGTNAFNGQARWLQIGVRTNSNNAMNPWINLSPRQPLSCAPLAMFAGNAAKADMAAAVADGAITASKLASGSLAWSNISGIPSGFADGIDHGAYYTAGPGLNLDWLFKFSVDFGGSGTATSAARSDHGHFGTTWGGSASLINGLSVTNGANNSVGLYGQQGTGSGFPYLFGNTAGVWGESSHGNGVWGASGHTNGSGVVGLAATMTGSNAGVTGRSISSSGAGVRGVATATTGTNVGVVGQSDSTSGAGIRGVATALSGPAIGVHGETASDNGQAVQGLATASSGSTAGVFGQSDSTSGTGVSGNASAATGATVGVRGESHSVQGFGVVARNDLGVAFKAAGSGIIQSDAGSAIWIPGCTGRASNAMPHGGRLHVYDDCDAEFPLTLPGNLYGQNTVVKSIDVIYSCYDADNDYITQTQVIDDELSVLYTDALPHISNTRTNYTVPFTYYFANSARFLTLRVSCKVDNAYVFIHGIRVRLGHK
jgi:hypothetical protein